MALRYASFSETDLERLFSVPDKEFKATFVNMLQQKMEVRKKNLRAQMRKLTNLALPRKANKSKRGGS